MTSSQPNVPKPPDRTEAEPTWPRDLPLTALDDGVSAPYGELAGTLEPGGQLKLSAGSDELLIGVQDSATTLRLIPTLGPLPLLVFVRPTLRCATGRSLIVELDIPLYLTLGVGSPSLTYTPVHEMPPVGVRRALYGPVDAGVICRSVYTHAATELDARDPDDLSARLRLSVYNAAQTTLEVTKIMLPVDHLTLFQHPEHGVTAGSVRMKLLGPKEAELDFSSDAPPGASPVLGLNGERQERSRAPLLFTYTYKNKTGLEYGF
jgi:hypothetical protein